MHAGFLWNVGECLSLVCLVQVTQNLTFYEESMRIIRGVLGSPISSVSTILREISTCCEGCQASTHGSTRVSLLEFTFVSEPDSKDFRRDP